MNKLIKVHPCNSAGARTGVKTDCWPGGAARDLRLLALGAPVAFAFDDDWLGVVQQTVQQAILLPHSAAFLVRSGPRRGDIAPCRSRFACCSRIMSDIDSIDGWPGCMEHGAAEARLVELLDRGALETDALVSLQHGFLFPPITARDAAVALSYGGRNMGNLEAPDFAGMRRATKRIEGFQEKRPDEIRLQAAGFGLLHFFLHDEETLRAHRLLCERVAVEQRLQVLVV
jgi:hypothetical protein